MACTTPSLMSSSPEAVTSVSRQETHGPQPPCCPLPVREPSSGSTSSLKSPNPSAGCQVGVAIQANAMQQREASSPTASPAPATASTSHASTCSQGASCPKKRHTFPFFHKRADSPSVAPRSHEKAGFGTASQRVGSPAPVQSPVPVPIQQRIPYAMQTELRAQYNRAGCVISATEELWGYNATLPCLAYGTPPPAVGSQDFGQPPPYA